MRFLKDKMIEKLKNKNFNYQKDKAITISILGNSRAGKSQLCNRLCFKNGAKKYIGDVSKENMYKIFEESDEQYSKTRGMWMLPIKRQQDTGCNVLWIDGEGVNNIFDGTPFNIKFCTLGTIISDIIIYVIPDSDFSQAFK